MPGFACPICRRSTERSRDAAFPFCSPRCRLIDLGRWLREDYRLPAEPVAPAEAEREGASAGGGAGSGR